MVIVRDAEIFAISRPNVLNTLIITEDKYIDLLKNIDFYLKSQKRTPRVKVSLTRPTTCK